MTMRWMLRATAISLMILGAGCAGGKLPGRGADRGKTVLYRDTWGVAHIYSPTVEGGMYAMGWAHAEDRPEELLKNFSRAMGESSKFDGPGGVLADLRMKMWDHYGISKEKYGELGARVRGYLESYCKGINDFYAAHPKDLPEWWGKRQVDPYMVIAFGRMFLYNWSIDDGYDDLKRGGIKPNAPRESRGSNQFAISPKRSAEGVPILYIDPHLSWWGPSRFWEFRIHAGELVGSGFTLAGSPNIGLGHNENVAWANTTGGPDTADVYELKLNPADPMEYMYDGSYRKLTAREVSIDIKGAGSKKFTLLSSHHGPIVATAEGKAYALKSSYADQVKIVEAWLEFNFAKDYRGFMKGMATQQIFPQNVMVADTKGNIYYQRTGRVPIRPDGVDCSKPLDGSTSKTEWLGIHPSSDMVQTLNPEQGYMQNCNIPPDVMMVDSPMTPDKYPPYIFSDLSHGPRGGWSNQRGARAVELLASDDSVTVEEALAYGLDIQPYGVKRWIAMLKEADGKFGAEYHSNPDYMAAVKDLLAWNGELDQNSAAALKYFYWKQQLKADYGDRAEEASKRVDRILASVKREPGNYELPEEEMRAALRSIGPAMAKLKTDHGSLDAKYGDKFRVGRDDKSWPVSGGGPKELGVTTLRVVGFGAEKPDKTRWGQSGQTSTEIVVLAKPIRSFTGPPIGQSDRPDSPHYRDQAEKNFSKRTMKPSWWTPEELAGHIESRNELAGAPKPSFWRRWF